MNNDDLLSDKEKENIKKYCKEKKLFGNIPELLCAMEIIENVLGREWCVASTNNKFRETKGRLFDFAKKHPLSQLLGKEVWNAKDMGKVILFAHYLEDLYRGDDFKEKIRKYVKNESRSEITYHAFESLFFELRVASAYNRSGLQVEFLRESNVPSPDLKIRSKNGSSYLECKKKRYHNEWSISSILDTIRKAHDKQLIPRKESGIIAIDLSLPNDIFESRRTEILGKIQLLIKDMELVNFVDVYNETSWSYDDERSIIGFNKNVVENPYPRKELSREIISAVYNSQLPLYKPFIS